MNRESGRRPRFKRTLGLFDATAISVGAIIGAGIFVVTGIAAGLAGSALVVSMLIAAIISMFTALSFAELAAWLPKEGSIYEYAYQLISPFAGFLVGWVWMLSNVCGGAAVSLGFAHYLAALFPTLPVSWIAAFLCLAFAGLNYFGIQQSARFNDFIVVAKLMILALFVILGFSHFKSANFVPFAPFKVGVIYGACFIFFAYGGFARVAIVADEIKDAKHNVPRAILLISGDIHPGLHIGRSRGCWTCRRLRARRLKFSSNQGHWGRSQRNGVFHNFGGSIIGDSKRPLDVRFGSIPHGLCHGQRKDIPEALSKLHRKHNTPYQSIWISGALMALLVLISDLSKVVAISTFALLFYYSFANISALRLKVENGCTRGLSRFWARSHAWPCWSSFSSLPNKPGSSA